MKVTPFTYTIAIEHLKQALRYTPRAPFDQKAPRDRHTMPETRRSYSPLRSLAIPALLLLLSPQASASRQGTREVQFNRDVRPLLAARCLHCHGPDEKKRKAKLRLDRADGPHGAYRIRDGKPAIKPRDPNESSIIYRLTTDNRKDGR